MFAGCASVSACVRACVQRYTNILFNYLLYSLYDRDAAGAIRDLPLSYIFYGVSSAGVSCRRRWPPPTTPASPDNAIGLVAHCELGGYVKLGWLLEAAGRTFSHRHANPARVGVVRWSSACDS